MLLVCWFFFNERNIRICSDIIFAVVPETHWSLQIAPITFYVLTVFWDVEDWGTNSLPQSNLLGLSAQSKPPEDATSQAVNVLFCFLFAEYCFQNQLDFRSSNDGWSQECIISGWGPTESPSYILRHRPDTFYAGHGHGYMQTHSDVFHPPTPQVKLALDINSNLLFQLGFYSWILDTMCCYTDHLYSDHILLSIC